MFKIIYNKKAYYQLDNFINSYKNIFKNIYFDTGIVNQDLIINTYIEAGEKLKKEIFELITFKISSDIILGKRVSEKGIVSLILQVGNFRIFIDYLEDINLKERYIENIEFYKK